MSKKIAVLLICAGCFTSAILFSSCGNNSATEENSNNENKVNVCSWGEYIDESLIDQFEEETGIKVNYTTFESNETLYAILKTGGANYDVIVPSDYMVARLIKEDMLEKLDFSNIPNYSLIGDEFKNLEYDPTNEYSVPYTWGTLGIIYNTKVVTEDVTSWDIMFDSKYKNQILMIDNPRDAFAIALLDLGYSINTENQSEIEEAMQLLKDQKPIVQAYVMDQIFDKLESGEAAIGAYYAGDFLTMHENNPDLAFCIPEEGSNWFVDALCIPKGAEHKQNAEKWINFMCSTEASIANTDYIWYGTPNVEAAKLYSEEVDPFTAEILFPSDDVLSKCQMYLDLSSETLSLYNDLWILLKA